MTNKHAHLGQQVRTIAHISMMANYLTLELNMMAAYHTPENEHDGGLSNARKYT